MRKFHSALVAICLGTSALAMFSAPTMAQIVGVVLQADFAPPPLPVYDQPPIPGPDYIWTPGYWAWGGDDYYWVPGTWVEAPERELLWTPAYWGFDSGAYVFYPGYWGRHCGYYGGISYGFGYTGTGYEGGYWNNGAFFYNRYANNLGNVSIVNVYNTVIVNNTTINNVSYSGGPGGVVAQPTPAQAVAAKELHIQPTALQVQHVQAASANPALFASKNHGLPPVAATARPADLKGPGVVPAKAVGSLPNQPVGQKATTGVLPAPIKPIPGGKALPAAPAGVLPPAPKAPSSVGAPKQPLVPPSGQGKPLPVPPGAKTLPPSGRTGLVPNAPSRTPSTPSSALPNPAPAQHVAPPVQHIAPPPVQHIAPPPAQHVAPPPLVRMPPPGPRVAPQSPGPAKHACGGPGLPPCPQ